MAEVESFIVYSDWLDSIKGLPIEQQDKIIADTIRYGLGREQIYNADPVVASFVKMKSRDISISKEKYEQKKNLAKQAGRKKQIDDEIIFDLACEGKSSAEIATLLGISKSSVDHSDGWRNRKKFLQK